MRDAKHFKNLINKNPNASIGFTLAASAVYASRYVLCENEHHGTPEWKQIARDLKSKYGETLTAEETLAEMQPITNETMSVRIPSDLLDMIDQQAKTESRTRSNMIIAALKEKFCKQ